MTNRSEYLIGQVTELDEEPSILIEKCFEIKRWDTYNRSQLLHAQRDLFLTSEVILTIVDPSEKITKEYKAKNG